MRRPYVTILLLAGCAANSATRPGSIPGHGADAHGANESKNGTDIDVGGGTARRGPTKIGVLERQFAGVKPIRTFTGKATYYSNSLAGHRMASGEQYDPQSAQAAHRTLPFGTIVRVNRESTNQSVVVRITDRGPYGARGRIIDLSHAAAEKIGLIRAGVADVRVEVLEIPSGR
jgi:rare lipoprotein A